ncbi:hypothetical protein KAF25_002059 [Fusarium avenaceum]|uniref:CorA-like transporter domain-containing protein n=1 Tax=Fusarium avenaceum TaxID=40199 RepID=A0A9P7H5Q6_9HYPO|nr:hypothetical protein KAF25_002059 [Fusarium avenaceum]
MSENKAWPSSHPEIGVRTVSTLNNLAKNSEQVFSKPNELFEIEVAEIGSQGTEEACLKGENQLQEHLSVYHDHLEPSKYDQGRTKNNYRASFFLLEPMYSWSHLPVTHNGAIKLLSALQVFPEIHRYITAFSEKRFPRDEGFGGFDSHITMNGYGTWMEFDWTHIHATCFGSVDGNVRCLINYLDEEITAVFKRVIMAGVEPNKLNEFDALHSTASDLKSLQYLSDQVRRVINLIQLNKLTLEVFQERIRHLESITPLASSQANSLRVFLTKLSQFQKEHEFSLVNASAVLERAKATSEQLRDTVSVRNGEFNKTSTEMTSRNTTAIVDLSHKSGREAHVVKTLTVLALVYVPASYVADFLQMGFVSIKQETPMQWSATADLKIYAVLAIPLITFTMLIYAFVELAHRSKNNQQGLNGSHNV